MRIGLLLTALCALALWLAPGTAYCETASPKTMSLDVKSAEIVVVKPSNEPKLGFTLDYNSVTKEMMDKVGVAPMNAQWVVKCKADGTDAKPIDAKIFDIDGEKGMVVVPVDRLNAMRNSQYALGIRLADGSICWDVKTKCDGMVCKDAEDWVTLEKQAPVTIDRLGYATLTDDNRAQQFLDGVSRPDPFRFGFSLSLAGLRTTSGLLDFSIQKALFSSQRYDKDATIPMSLRYVPISGSAWNRPHPIYSAMVHVNPYWVNQDVFVSAGFEQFLSGGKNDEVAGFSKMTDAPRIALVAEAGLPVGAMKGEQTGQQIFRLHGSLLVPRQVFGKLHPSWDPPYLEIGLHGWQIFNDKGALPNSSVGYVGASLCVPCGKNAIKIEFGGGRDAAGGFQLAPMKWTFSLANAW